MRSIAAKRPVTNDELAVTKHDRPRRTATTTFLLRKARRGGVDRGYQYAVDEARARTLEKGLSDVRDAVVERWASHLTLLRPPILVTGEVTGSGFEYELLVGFTRLRNLLGLLDRQEVPEMKRS